MFGFGILLFWVFLIWVESSCRRREKAIKHEWLNTALYSHLIKFRVCVSSMSTIDMWDSSLISSSTYSHANLTVAVISGIR